MRGSALVVLALLVVPVGFAARGSVTEERDERGRLVLETRTDERDARLFVATHYLYAEAAASTDCVSTKYRTAGWRWTGAYSAYASAYADEFAASAAAWDAETSRALVGSIAAGSLGTAGQRDGVNQLAFADLGSGSTIAVTTTWYSRATGVAVESDAQYNTRFAWATNGSATAMDVANIATHELGHTFGLTHPKGGLDIACLTMYAYASGGETQKRTLGDGDIRGIRALYGG